MLEATPTSATIETPSPASDRDRVDVHLAEFLAESRRRHAANPHARPMYDRAAEFVLKGGKRLRPRLALASYRIAAGAGEPPKPAWVAASSLELFHAFMLVHDDLIDGSLVRRDRPTLHEAIRRDADWPDDPRGRKLGSDLALIAGDLLCALGMRMLGRSGLDDSALGRVHRLVSDMLLETGVGEALDVLFGDCPLEDLSEAQVLDAYLRKTARYSVSAPLVLGAVMAGSSGAVIKALRRFGDLLGLGYQLRNDLDALDDAASRGDCPDLDGGKRTWLLWAAHRRLGETGRRALLEGLAMPAGAERCALLLGLIETSGAIGECRSRVGSFGREAVAVLREAPLDARQRRSYLGLVSQIGGPPRPCLADADPVLDAVAFPPLVAEVPEGV